MLIWARTPDVAETIRARHENPLYLPGQRLDRAIQATADLDEAARVRGGPAGDAGAASARPSRRELARHLPKATPVVICAKGIEQESGLLMTEVIAATAARPAHGRALRPDLRRRGGARAADRGDPGRADARVGAPAREGPRHRHLPALSLRRSHRRRDRRRGEERAGHRLRHRHGAHASARTRAPR